MRLLTTLLLLSILLPSLSAERLPDRLRMLMPGEGRTVVRERRLVENRLQDILYRLEHDDRLGQLPPAVQMATLTRRLRADLLREHRPGTSLTDVVREGLYTDATAAIVYALSLEHFNIPYEAYVDHWEANLLVYPGSERLRLGRPATKADADAATTGFRREYLSLVRNTVALDLPALTARQADSVFYAYYYRPDQRLTLRQLSGYQQLRRAQFAYATGDYSSVLDYLEHARTLDDRPAFTVLEQAAELQLTALGSLGNGRQADRLFASWLADPDNPYYGTALLHHFDRTQSALLTDGALDEAVRTVQIFSLRAPAQFTDWQQRVRLVHAIRLLEYYRAQGMVVQALEIAQNLLQRDPDNGYYQHFVAELGLYDVRRNYPEPQRQLERLRELRDAYPFVVDYPDYADIILRESALRIRDAYAVGRQEKAGRELDYFRAQLDRLPPSEARSLWTMTAFIAASQHHFAREEYATALRLVEEALRYDPQNDFLLHERDLIRRY